MYGDAAFRLDQARILSVLVGGNGARLLYT